MRKLKPHFQRWPELGGNKLPHKATQKQEMEATLASRLNNVKRAAFEDEDEDDDMPALSAHALLALNEFLSAQTQQAKAPAEVAVVEEDWQLSQFWVPLSTSSPSIPPRALHLCFSFGLLPAAHPQSTAVHRGDGPHHSRRGAGAGGRWWAGRLPLDPDRLHRPQGAPLHRVRPGAGRNEWNVWHPWHSLQRTHVCRAVGARVCGVR